MTDTKRSSSTGTPRVRDATEADMAEVQAIYAHYVLNGLATFEEVPPSTDELVARRAAAVAAGMPYLVATVEDRVVGYSYVTPYRARPAYRYTVEDSVYVAEDQRGRGLGRTLLSSLIERCESGRWRQMIAVIAVVGDGADAGSIVLHEKLGFRRVGTLEAVGFKLGKWVDTVLMQRALNTGSQTSPDGPDGDDAGG
jgi:phosphinothricin acetyltransferase